MRTENTVSEYDQQAEAFLASNGLKLRVTLSDSKVSAWAGDYVPKKTCPECKGVLHNRTWPLGHPQTIWEQERGINNPVYTPKNCPNCKGTGEVEDTSKPKSGHHYRVTISRAHPKMEHGRPWSKANGQAARLTFDFWGSIKDAEEGRAPSAYSVLACISGDVYTPETFEDFCAKFGYEQGSIKALQTFRRCAAFAKRLRQFFTAAELEQLSQI